MLSRRGRKKLINMHGDRVLDRIMYEFFSRKLLESRFRFPPMIEALWGLCRIMLSVENLTLLMVQLLYFWKQFLSK